MLHRENNVHVKPFSQSRLSDAQGRECCLRNIYVRATIIYIPVEEVTKKTQKPRYDEVPVTCEK